MTDVEALCDAYVERLLWQLEVSGNVRVAFNLMEGVWVRPRRAASRVVAVLAVAAVASACGAARSSAGSSPTTTMAPARATDVDIVTGPEHIREVPRPHNVADEAFQWFEYPAPDRSWVVLGIKRVAGAGPHPGILLVHASGGLNTDYVDFANDLTEKGFDVAIGCWFQGIALHESNSSAIQCADAPVFKGVVESAVPDLDSLVRATHHGLGSSERLTLVGFSRGAGITALRASQGEGSEPVVLTSGMYDGTNTIGSNVPGGEVNIVAAVKQGAPWKVPALILHGTGDGAVPVSQAQALAAALRARGISVKEQYYPGAGHNLLGEPAILDEVVQQMTTFVCAQFACPATS